MKSWRKCNEDCFNCKYSDCIKPEEMFRFRDYKKEYEQKLKKQGKTPMKPHKKKICRCELDGSVVAEYESVASAGRELGGNARYIARAARTGKKAYGYIWRYA